MRGFTIVELIITITIMGILLTLAVVAVNTTQANARDDRRKSDVATIGLNLESYYMSGTTTATTASTITNLVPNPAVSSNATGWSIPSTGGASGTNAIMSGDGPQNISDTYYRRSTTTAVTSSPLSIAATATGVAAIPVDGNTTYTISGYVRTSRVLTGGVRIDITSYDAAGASLGDTTGSYNSRAQIPNTWQRIYRQVTTSADTRFIRVKFAFSGGTGAPAGSTFDATGVLVTQGSTLYDYADGSFTDWTWNGTIGASTSSGPSVTAGKVSAYPPILLTTSALTLEYLSDLDPKLLIPPGGVDAATSFIPATNAIQTVAGVTPKPTTSQYVYQPIDNNGLLCISSDCRKFNIYYRLENGGAVQKYESKNR